MNSLHDPAEELRYLLSRGYPKSSALDFVCNHHTLTSKERNILVRVVHEKDVIDSVKKKLVTVEESRGRKIGIDGFNVMATSRAILKGETVFECDDGIIRDASGLFGKFRLDSVSKKAIEISCGILRDSELNWFFDKNVSRSGEFAGFTRNLLKEEGIRGGAFTVKSVDYELKNWNGIVATGDTGIILKVKKVIDIPRYITELLNVRPLKI